ncbi:MAG: hypothetical protein ACP5NX_03965 [Candidatus Bilamarchaeaceae archaeon]
MAEDRFVFATKDKEAEMGGDLNAVRFFNDIVGTGALKASGYLTSSQAQGNEFTKKPQKKHHVEADGSLTFQGWMRLGEDIMDEQSKISRALFEYYLNIAREFYKGQADAEEKAQKLAKESMARTRDLVEVLNANGTFGTRGTDAAFFSMLTSMPRNVLEGKFDARKELGAEQGMAAKAIMSAQEFMAVLTNTKGRTEQQKKRDSEQAGILVEVQTETIIKASKDAVRAEKNIKTANGEVGQSIMLAVSYGTAYGDRSMTKKEAEACIVAQKGIAKDMGELELETHEEKKRYLDARLMEMVSRGELAENQAEKVREAMLVGMAASDEFMKLAIGRETVQEKAGWPPTTQKTFENIMALRGMQWAMVSGYLEMQKLMNDDYAAKMQKELDEYIEKAKERKRLDKEEVYSNLEKNFKKLGLPEEVAENMIGTYKKGGKLDIEDFVSNDPKMVAKVTYAYLVSLNASMA